MSYYLIQRKKDTWASRTRIYCTLVKGIRKKESWQQVTNNRKPIRFKLSDITKRIKKEEKKNKKGNIYLYRKKRID